VIALLLAFLLAAPVPCPHPHRRTGAVAKFRRANPCPAGPDKGSKTRCRGYVVDHVCALACCGLDAPQNMQYQTRAEAKAKDRVELQCARFCTERRPGP
jgi:hypothetical protein